MSAEQGSVDWKHDRVHVLVHDFLGGKDAVGKWLGTNDKSPTPAEETLVNMIHRAAALKGRGDSPEFTDRDLERYFERDINLLMNRKDIPAEQIPLYFHSGSISPTSRSSLPETERSNYSPLSQIKWGKVLVEKFIAKYREMERTPGFDKLLDASHAMWTEAGDLLL